MADTAAHITPTVNPEQALPEAAPAANAEAPVPKVENLRRLRPATTQPKATPVSVEPSKDIRVKITVSVTDGAGTIVESVGEAIFPSCAESSMRMPGYRAFVNYSNDQLRMAQAKYFAWCEPAPVPVKAPEKTTQDRMNEALASEIPALSSVINRS